MFKRLTQALTTLTQINNRYSRIPDSKRSWLALPDISSVIGSDDNFRIIVALVPEFENTKPVQINHVTRFFRKNKKRFGECNQTYNL